MIRLGLGCWGRGVKPPPLQMLFKMVRHYNCPVYTAVLPWPKPNLGYQMPYQSNCNHSMGSHVDCSNKAQKLVAKSLLNCLWMPRFCGYFSFFKWFPWFVIHKSIRNCVIFPMEPSLSLYLSWLMRYSAKTFPWVKFLFKCIGNFAWSKFLENGSPENGSPDFFQIQILGMTSKVLVKFLSLVN